MSFTIHAITDSDRAWVLEIVRGWGADFIVSRGRKVYAAQIDGFYAIDNNGQRVGLTTYEIIGGQCELVTLDAFEKFSGIGSALTEKVIEIARERECKRLWLITTNDNLDAIRFYQRRGFVWAAVHVGAINESRKIKPSIAEIGNHNIPLRDEIEFEKRL
ncbi:MAG: GNAT family N-acetyltransferase [candidate division Zixibacteria bacterium]|nr:GNAT family N-acetyltransferase [candidate division Zixibacteria bacterium]